MDGKLVFGYGGIANTTPCVYKDHGWFEGTIPEYNIRKVETIELFEELTSRDEAKTEGEPYGCSLGGGLCQLCEISFDLRLNDLLNADDSNFAHDICGIQKNINRETREIENFFVPRFASSY